MKRPISTLLPMVLYAGLLLSLGLSVWSLARTETYRQRSEVIASQALEIRSRVWQAREHVARIAGALELARQTGKSVPQLAMSTRLLRFNLSLLSRLEYVRFFLGPNNQAELDGLIAGIDDVLLPAAVSGRNYQQALQSIISADRYLVRLSSTTVNSSQGLSVAVQIANDAARNRLRLFAALSALLLSVIAIHQYNKTTREKDQHIKSFSLLFAHMTRTRIAALRLFLGYLNGPLPPPLEMTDAAMRTVVELDSINEGLMIIGHARHQAKLSPLGRIIGDIARGCQNDLAVEADTEARETLVPASQFHLLIDELVRNATNAVAGRDDQVITISAVIRQRLLRRPLLILTVSDNGSGMTQELLAKVREPFFSTKAGKHVGLGLTNCVELMKTMAGKLEISSTPGAGTSVRITYSVR
jgi:signal transduction histidine kinase